MYLESLIDQFMKAGLTKELAQRIAVCRALYITLNVIEVSGHESMDLIKNGQSLILQSVDISI